MPRLELRALQSPHAGPFTVTILTARRLTARCLTDSRDRLRLDHLRT